MASMRKIGFILACSAMGTSALLAHNPTSGTNTVTALGCGGAGYNVDGTSGTWDGSGNSSLPGQFGCYAQSGNSVSTVAATGATATTRNTAINHDSTALFQLSFQIKSTKPLPGGLSWALVGTERGSAYADGRTWSNGQVTKGTGHSTGRTYEAYTSVTATAITGDPIEKTDGPKGRKTEIKVSGLFWGPVTGGQACVAKFPGGLLQAICSASGPGISGPGLGPVVSRSGASGGYAFYPSGAKSSGTPGILTITMPPGRESVRVDLYNASGGLVDQWGCDGAENGVAWLHIDDYAPGTYTVAFQARGTLVKKMVLNLDPNTPLSVSPAWVYGDLDFDNVVSQSEVSFIQFHVGYVISRDPIAPDKFFSHDDGPHYRLVDADLNGDGTITQADVNLASANLGVHGD